MRSIRPLTWFLLPALAACADGMTTVDETTSPAFSSTAATGPAGEAEYEVTIMNLTSGQEFTPPLAAVHRQPAGMFTVGAAASFGLKEIAENGNLGPMQMRLEGDRHVADVVVAVGPVVPPLLPGESIQFGMRGERGAKYFSFAAMLICTNDGFTGVDGARLPSRVGETLTWETAGYDAGTELNTEDFADIVPPCPALSGVPSGDDGTGQSDPALAENGIIRHHPGIQGGNDLVVAVHGWTDPVARVVITRVR